MGPAALAVMFAAGTLMQVSGSLSQADAAERAGEQALENERFKSEQLRQDAGQAMAASQRAADEEQRRARLVASRALAIGGASGGGLSDPTVAGILGDLSGEGAYRAASALYEGADRARKLELGADVALLEGQSAHSAGKARAGGMRTAAYGTLIQGIAGSSLYAKYGGGGPKAGSTVSSGGWIDAGTPSFNPTA